MRVGAHVSVSGGLHKAFDWTAKFGCESLQIFTKSQLRWDAKPLTAGEIQAWLTAWDKTERMQCLVHNSYLINLATPDDELRQKSISGMIVELERAAALEIPWVITHPGSARDAGEEAGLKFCAGAIRDVLKKTRKLNVGILLETTAGTGSNIGGKFEHFGYLLRECAMPPERLGVCLDTCHVFAAGYDLKSEAGYAETFQQFDQLIGLSHLRAFHLNDSLKPLGSHRDRHAPIGEGEIGPEAFARLMRDERFAGIPGATELVDEVTPQGLALLKSFREDSKPKATKAKPKKPKG